MIVTLIVLQYYYCYYYYCYYYTVLPRRICRRTQLVTDMGRRHLWSADVHTCAVPRPQTWLGDRSLLDLSCGIICDLPVELRQRDIRLSELRRLLKTFWFAETRSLVTFCLSAPCTSALTSLLTYCCHFSIKDLTV